MFKVIYPEMMRDKKKEADMLSRHKAIDWTLILLPLVLGREKTTNVKVNLSDMQGFIIGNKDIAQFTISQIKGEGYIHKTPFIVIK